MIVFLISTIAHLILESKTKPKTPSVISIIILFHFLGSLILAALKNHVGCLNPSPCGVIRIMTS